MTESDTTPAATPKRPLPVALMVAGAAAVLALVSLALSVGPGFDTRVRSYLLANPQVLVEVSTKLQQQQEQQALAAVRQTLLRDRRALERDPGDYVANPNGRVTLTQFYDYRCPHCINVAPGVLELVRTDPEVRVVFKEMPIFGAPSERAARAALAVKAAGGDYLAVHEQLMAARPLDDAAIDRILSAQGIDPRRADDPALNAQLTRNHALAASLGIDATPTFVLGDQVFPGLRNDDVGTLRPIIEAAKRAAR